MLKMLKAVIVSPSGEKTTIKTYAQETANPGAVMAPFLASGGHIESYEWIDTLTEQRKAWNEENPDTPIPVNL